MNQVKYKIRSVIDAVQNPSPPDTDMVGDGVMVEGSRVCVVGDPKIGKSIFTIGFGLSIAAGRDYLGLHMIRPYNVLYLNLELPEHEMDKRVSIMKRKYLFPVEIPFRYLTLLGKEVPILLDEEGKQKYLAIINELASQGFHTEVLIVDCRWRTLAGKEDDKDIKVYCSLWDDVMKERKLQSLVVVHHHGKETKGAGKGSNYWDAWLTTMIDFTAKYWTGRKGVAAPSKEVRVTIGGTYTSGKTLYLHRIGKSYRTTEPWEDEVVSKKEVAMNFIREQLREGEKEQEILLQKALKSGIKRATFFEAKAKMESSGDIESYQAPNRQGRYNTIRLRG